MIVKHENKTADNEVEGSFSNIVSNCGLSCFRNVVLRSHPEKRSFDLKSPLL